MYYFTVAAVNGVGSSGDELRSPPVGIFCAPEPDQPPKPVITTTASTLTVALPAPTAEQLNGANHTGWRILFDDENDGDDIYKETVVYDTTVTEYVFSSAIEMGHFYRAKVKLCSIVSCSRESLPSDAVIIASTPTAPTQLHQTSTTDTSISLAWSFSGSDGGTPILGWNVYWSIDGETWPSAQSAHVDEVSVMRYDFDCLAALRPMSYVWFKVAAASDAGVGAKSTVVPVLCSAVPDTPVEPAPLSYSTTHVTVAWSMPTERQLHNAFHLSTKIFVDDGLGGPFTVVTLSDTLQTSFTRTDVSGGRAYRFKMRIVSQSGESLDSPVRAIVAASVPEVPIITVFRSSDTVIEYSWKAGASGGSPIIGWQLFRSSDGLIYDYAAPLATLAPSMTSYILDCSAGWPDGHSSAREYVWLRIRAISGLPSPNHLEGALAVASKWRCSAVPDTPAAPVLVSSTANTITISFQTSDLHNALLTGFKIYTITAQSISDDGSMSDWSVETITDITQLTFTKYGLTAGLSYYFKVQVITEVGMSGISESSRLYAAATPDPPSLSVASSSNSTIKLQWTPNYDGGSQVLNWQVYTSTDGQTWPEAGTYTISNTAVNDSLNLALDCTDRARWIGLDGGMTTVQQEYVYMKTSGVNIVGEGVPSATLRWRCSGTPAAQAKPLKVSGTTSSITVSYEPTDTDGAIHLGYKVLFANDENGDVSHDDYKSVYITATSQTSYTVAGLTAGRRYQIRTKIISEIGESAVSPPLQQVCGAIADQPSTVRYVSSYPAASGSSNESEFLTTVVAWDFFGFNGGSPVMEWYIYMSSVPDMWSASYDYKVSADTMELTFDCRRMRYVYMRVAAKTEAALGQLSTTSRFFCSLRPARPTARDVSGTESSVTCAWDVGELYGADLVAYNIFLDDGLGGNLSAITLRGVQDDTSKKYFTATGLQPDRNYRARVSVISSVGESELSDIVNVRSCGFPGAVAAPVRAAGGTATSIVLRWATPADGGCPITSYDVEWNDAGNVVCNVHADVNSCEKAGLTRGSSPKFRVVAKNSRGVSASPWATHKSAAEPEVMVAPVQDNVLSTPTSIAMRWTAPDMRGGRSVGYRVFRNNGVGTDISSTPDSTCGMARNPAPQQCALKGLTPGETYSVAMSAINDVGESALSAAATVKSATIPETMVFGVGETSKVPTLKFTWTLPDNKGAPIYNWQGRLFRTDLGGFPAQDSDAIHFWDAGGTEASPLCCETEVTFTSAFESAGGNLVRQKQFYFKVRAVNEMGAGNWSDLSCGNEGTLASLTTCAVPRGWTVDAPRVDALVLNRDTNFQPNKIKVYHQKVVGDNDAGGDDPNELIYELYGGPDTSDMALLVTGLPSQALPDGNIYYEHAVPSGDTFYFKLRTANRAGKTSAFTDPTAFGPQVSGTLPDAPASCHAVKITAILNSADIKVYWMVPTSDGGTPITSYSLTLYVNGVNGIDNRYTNAGLGTASPTPVGGVTYDLEYFWTNIPTGGHTVLVSATNALGDSPVCTVTNVNVFAR
jgi:hypothetical protein